jgi:hypothetical protein
VDPEFAYSILDGLSAQPKALSSRYFYDESGNRLFQSIMATPEYYLTDCELEIFRHQGDDIAGELLKCGPCEFIELGSGDGQKVGFLLDALHRRSSDWKFRPVDISDHSLELLAANLLPSRPWLQLDPIHGNYFDVLKSLRPGQARRVLMFLGSNLGNYGVRGSIEFLQLVRAAMVPGDAILIGLDLKKDPDVIRAAYNDASGHTTSTCWLASIVNSVGHSIQPFLSTGLNMIPKAAPRAVTSSAERPSRCLSGHCTDISNLRRVSEFSWKCRRSMTRISSVKSAQNRASNPAQLFMTNAAGLLTRSGTR